MMLPLLTLTLSTIAVVIAPGLLTLTSALVCVALVISDAHTIAND